MDGVRESIDPDAFVKDGRNFRHGTNSAYCVAACRCDPCRADHAAVERRRAERRITGTPLYVPSIGFRRRFQALATQGWTTENIAERLGISQSGLGNQLRGGKILTRHHLNMVAIYADLEDLFGTSTRSSAIARGKGWAPPAAWDNIDDPKERPKGVPKR